MVLHHKSSVHLNNTHLCMCVALHEQSVHLRNQQISHADGQLHHDHRAYAGQQKVKMNENRRLLRYPP